MNASFVLLDFSLICSKCLPFPNDIHSNCRLFSNYQTYHSVVFFLIELLLKILSKLNDSNIFEYKKQMGLYIISLLRPTNDFSNQIYLSLFIETIKLKTYFGDKVEKKVVLENIFWYHLIDWLTYTQII